MTRRKPFRLIEEESLLKRTVVVFVTLQMRACAAQYIADIVEFT